MFSFSTIFYRVTISVPNIFIKYPNMQHVRKIALKWEKSCKVNSGERKALRRYTYVCCVTLKILSVCFPKIIYNLIIWQKTCIIPCVLIWVIILSLYICKRYHSRVHRATCYYAQSYQKAMKSTWALPSDEWKTLSVNPPVNRCLSPRRVG